MRHGTVTRRAFVLGSLSVAASLAQRTRWVHSCVRALTQGPRYHWFGYYDKFQLDPMNRYVLGMAVGFENRSPAPDDEVEIGMVDLREGYQWIALGKSGAWNWQQGCMLQWMPGKEELIIWNDREGDQYVSRILNVLTGKSDINPWPIYTLHPSGNGALTTDFRRLQDTQPGYGYAGLKDPYADDPAPEESGIGRLDLTSKRSQLVVPLARMLDFPFEKKAWTRNEKHWFNHLLYSPSGHRFAFLHRWRSPERRSFMTRLFTARPDGSDLYLLDPYGFTSHYIWRDDHAILAWARVQGQGDGFYLFEGKTGRIQPVGRGVMTRNGHCIYLPGGKFILNDTYPDEERFQELYLFDIARNEKVMLGRFYSPPQYRGEWRCDLHPRSSRDGQFVVIDSTHEGKGRQMYLIDLADLKL